MEVISIVDRIQILKLVAEGGMGVFDLGAILIAAYTSKRYFDREVHRDKYFYYPSQELQNQAMERDMNTYKKIGKDFAYTAKILAILSPILVFIVIILVSYS
jgi:hypothetical protein